MTQILQSLKTDQIALADVPCPRTEAGHVLIRTGVSLISAGTERMLLEVVRVTLEAAGVGPRQALDSIKAYSVPSSKANAEREGGAYATFWYAMDVNGNT